MENFHYYSLWHIIAILFYLKSVIGYVGLQGWLLNDPAGGTVVRRGHDRCRHQLKHVHEERARGHASSTGLQAKRTTGGDESGIDSSLSAAEREVFENFKKSVLNEGGRLRRMSDERINEIAEAAAASFVEQMLLDNDRKLEKAAAGRHGDINPYGYEDNDFSRNNGEGNLDISGGILRERSRLVDQRKLEDEREKNEEEDEEGAEGNGDGDGERLDFLESEAEEESRSSARSWGDVPWAEYGTEESEFKSILRELKAYHAQHGNLLLTHNYLLPKEGSEAGDGGAMEEQRGWRLGQKVYNMKFWQRHVRGQPERRETLAKLDFIWGRLQDDYNLFVEALLAYREIEGSLLVPKSFVVPEADPWPLSCQGMRLGARVAGVRNQSLYVRTAVERWYQLDNMGFVWDLSDAPFRQVFDALLTYRSLHGNLRVPVAFRVPSCGPWSEDTWKLALGQRVLDIRVHQRYIRDHPARARALDEAGFIWTDAGEASFTNVLLALKAFRKVHGRDFSVPSSFIVPSYLPWPQACWGLRLGTALVDIRSKGRYLKGEDCAERRRELERLGVFAQSRETILTNLVRGLRCYVLVVGDARVPQGFVVPDADPWPVECRGQKLGSILYGLRRHPERLDRYPDVKAELTSLGFSWDVPKRGPKGPRRRRRLLDLDQDMAEARKRPSPERGHTTEAGQITRKEVDATSDGKASSVPADEGEGARNTKALPGGMRALGTPSATAVSDERRPGSPGSTRPVVNGEGKMPRKGNRGVSTERRGQARATTVSHLEGAPSRRGGTRG